MSGHEDSQARSVDPDDVTFFEHEVVGGNLNEATVLGQENKVGPGHLVAFEELVVQFLKWAGSLVWPGDRLKSSPNVS